MAYGTQNSSALNVGNFGAKGDWIANDTAAIQRALNQAASNGAGTVYFPNGNYLTSGYLNLTGGLFNNVSIVADDAAWIRTAPSGDFRKILVSGASGVMIQGLKIDAGRTSGTNAQPTGTVYVYSAPHLYVRNCQISHSEGYHIYIQGNTFNCTFEDNAFDDFQVAMYSDSNAISGLAPNRIFVLNNRFINSWGTYPEQNFFGGIKFQNAGFLQSTLPTEYPTNRSYGHRIMGNVFSGTNQMGIEMWGYMSDTIISNNYIENSSFGVSIAASSYDIIVNGNTFKACYGQAIESADASSITISNNVIDGATGNEYTSQGTCFTQFGIILNGTNRSPNHNNVVGNIVRNCSNANIKTFATDQANIVGNTLTNTAANAGTCFYNQNSSHVNFSNNLMNQISTGFYFIFLDAGVSIASGITIANNDFNGSVSQWGILYYDAGNTGAGNKDILIQNNRTTNVQYCNFGMINYSSFPPLRALQQNNFGPTGGVGYSIPDAQYPAGSSPYGTSNIVDGFQYYTAANYAFTGSVPISSGAWMKIYSQNRGLVVDSRFKVMHPDQGPPYQYDGNEENVEFRIVSTPFGFNGAVISVEPQGTYFQGFNKGIVQEIRTNNPGGGATHEVWLNVISGSTGVSGFALNIYGTDNGLVVPPTLQWEYPSFSSNSVGIKLATTPSTLEKQTAGYGVGSGIAISSVDGSNLTVIASGTVSIPTLQLNSTISGAIAATGQAAWISANGAANGLSGNISTLSASVVYVTGNQNIAAIKTFNSGVFTGQLGVGLANPQATLHTSGTVRFDVQTSNTITANNTGFLLIPSGWMIWSLSGMTVKIPYYSP